MGKEEIGKQIDSKKFMQGEDSTWLRSCSLKRVVFELQNGSVVNAWCSGRIVGKRSS